MEGQGYNFVVVVLMAAASVGIWFIPSAVGHLWASRQQLPHKDWFNDADIRRQQERRRAYERAYDEAAKVGQKIGLVLLAGVFVSIFWLFDVADPAWLR